MHDSQSSKTPIAAIMCRVLDPSDPEGERSRLNKVDFADFKAAFAADPIGSLRKYPFGCAQFQASATDLEYNIMELYRDTSIESEANARVALEVFMQHPTNSQSPKPNPYTQGLMWNVMLKYPKLFLTQLSELTGQPPEALHNYMITYAAHARDGVPVPRVSANGAALRRIIPMPEITDTAPSLPSCR